MKYKMLWVHNSGGIVPMVDRISFFNSISGIDYPEMIVDFFDQFIALKQLVEDHGSISVQDKSENSITFIVQFANSNVLDQALKTVQSGPIYIYGRPINVMIDFISENQLKFILQ